ncbi:MAG: phenylacetate-CoA oxygenase subunit PaaC [Woeseiaceae bacterium]|nr:phenylacetate-CoA oxygenase subunit PaaC [Woeseiaceae bacterium]
MSDALLTYVLRLGDTALVTAQRMVERVADEPELEEELANANFALDYIGQARMLYTYAGELEGKGADEDHFAFRRDAQAFRNLLIAEQPNGHFGDAIVRQFLFESFYVLLIEALAKSSDRRLAEIAARAEKEVRYHLRYATQWLIRLGDGTDESHAKVQASLDEYWRYTGEFFAGDDVDAAIRDEHAGPDLNAIAEQWRENVAAVLAEATLTAPEGVHMVDGGRAGLHGESFGFLVAEMQHLQRAHPGVTW